MAAQLTTKLQQDPNNAEGWVMLARTYYALKRFPDAAGAFERAVALVPDNAALLSDYADTLGAAQGGTLAGKPTEIIDRALKADPNYWKALALAGTAAFDAKDYRKAVEYWERTKKVVPAESDFAKGLDGSIAEARELGGMAAFSAAPATAAPASASAAMKPAPDAITAPAKAAPAATGGKALAGTVRLAPSMVAQAAPDDVVFVFARAAQGSRMPLALVRTQVKDLPYAFTLDDSNAMAPDMVLSKFSEVVVGARVSKSGQAMPASGDLEGLSAPVKPGAAGVAVVIDRTLP
jgi:cytochrome c-type biogenesis protein CcmH